MMEGLLSPYRILDLTDHRGYLCGRLLADLGAQVIKIERPGGDPGRRLGPFYKDDPHPEKSLYWYAFNAGKKGITLNLETMDGLELFRELVRRSDVVVESLDVGCLDDIGAGYEQLARVNPKIILVSISPFGQHGPYSKYKACDLVVCALSGFLHLCGDPDRAPVRISFPQAFLHASADAACGTVAALFWRESTGQGQWVDVSAQVSISSAMMDAFQNWDVAGNITERTGHYRHRPGTLFRFPAHHECKDGFVYFILYGGKLGARGNRELVRWMESEGFATEFLKSIDWDHFDLYDPEVDQEFIDHLLEPIQDFFRAHTKTELFEAAVQRHIMIYPLNSTRDIAESPQLKERGYWTVVHHDELNDDISYPGSFVRLSETFCGIRSRAPLIGEHNEEIYVGELGLTKEDLIRFKETGVI